MEPDRESMQGRLLVAARELQDPNFAETVVLLVRHDAEGALGLVINRPSTATVQDVWKQISDAECHIDAPLWIGGPCAGPLMALHTRKSLQDMEVCPGLYFTSTADLLRRVLLAGTKLRCFVRYAGWSAGQLEHELDEGAWLVSPAHKKLIFADPSDLWSRLIRKLAGKSVFEALGIQEGPADLRSN